MKRRTLLLLLLAVMTLALSGCRRGDVSGVEVTAESSQYFSPGDIDEAAGEVIRFFRRHFGGCTLLSLRYEEARGRDRDGALVLLSDFETGDTGGDSSFEANEIYRNWSWTLTRDWLGRWTIDNYGYG